MITGDGRLFNQPAGARPGIRGFSALVYSSDTVSVRPIGEVDATFDPKKGVPCMLQLQLTFNNGTPQPWKVYSTAGHNPGDVYVLGDQVATAVTQSGAYPWTFHVQAMFGDGSTVDQYYSGVALVVANDASPFGAGWTLDGLNRLWIGSGGVMMMYGSGAAPRYFTTQCDGTYMSPPDDLGTLVKNGDGTFKYTSKYQVVWNFDSTGLLKTIVDPHGLAATFTYVTVNNNPVLSTRAWPDSSITTFTNTGGAITGIALAGGRSLTLTQSGGNLTGITDVDGTARAFTYDGQRHLTNAQWGTTNATYGYDSVTGVLNTVTRSQGPNTIWQLRPSNVVALITNPASSLAQVTAPLTDPRNFISTYSLDVLGWVQQLVSPDPAMSSQTWDRAPNEQVVIYGDQNGNGTLYSYGNNAADLLEITYADTGNEFYQYDGTNHRRTSF
jgi:YD repeat-containing protein